MGTLLGVAALFVFLGADFVGVVQLLVYVGGILVLTLFAVMLTHRIADVQVSNRAVGRLPALVLVGVVVGVDARASARRAAWVVEAPRRAGADHLRHRRRASSTDYLLPFELASIVLLAALVGAIVVSRKELQGAECGELGARSTSSSSACVLFALGLSRVLTRRNAIGILMGVELILNSANINYVAFARYGGRRLRRPDLRDLRHHARRRRGGDRPRDRARHLPELRDDRRRGDGPLRG